MEFFFVGCPAYSYAFTYHQLFERLEREKKCNKISFLVHRVEINSNMEINDVLDEYIRDVSSSFRTVSKVGTDDLGIFISNVFFKQ